MMMSEKAAQKLVTCPRLSVLLYTSFLWALYQKLLLSTPQRFPA